MSCWVLLSVLATQATSQHTVPHTSKKAILFPLLQWPPQASPSSSGFSRPATFHKSNPKDHCTLIKTQHLTPHYLFPTKKLVPGALHATPNLILLITKSEDKQQEEEKTLYTTTSPNLLSTTHATFIRPLSLIILQSHCKSHLFSKCIRDLAMIVDQPQRVD